MYSVHGRRPVLDCEMENLLFTLGYQDKTLPSLEEAPRYCHIAIMEIQWSLVIE